ncbi:Eco57I restriction-modification methylase domain-containing protein [uncultured Halomonas sp.]|mgnify:CR=1 FL=1|jgi:hypothetical protein|uniref:Eco57I restriction-modification methylase domain-containing protein n=1 Tax=uncultured Halomonas sp. TaxID=173971 RepID=UPI00263886CD|nr:Eco57I restriction-modification methylase domain-containing protein [uncultured Halomonas sp.]
MNISAQKKLALDHEEVTIKNPIREAVDELSREGGIEARGAIFTKSQVVDFILDISGYTVEKKLFEMSALEPSFGGGDFLLPMIERLLKSWKDHASESSPLSLNKSIKAIELHQESFDITKGKVLELLAKWGISDGDAEKLVGDWLTKDDYLITDINQTFDFIIGNPPYVRQERIPPVLLTEYRRVYQTMKNRADIYVAFIERSLDLLNPRGSLCFICADRWMKNKYGAPLRKMVHDSFHLKIFVDMVGTPAFSENVIAYPAITLISREKSSSTRVAHRPNIDRNTLSTLSNILIAKHLSDDPRVKEMKGVTNGSEPWLLESPDQMALLRRLESAFPSLEETGCKVGIGVATGADKAFIADFEAMDVEPSRKLKLAMTKDISSGEVEWRGKGVINPYNETGKGLVNLNEYPRLRKYLEDRFDVIAKRHCAKKSPARWYRTIDKIHPDLAKKPKLLIPDIKGQAHIVYEPGELYPHHNLYYVTSEDWQLRALQAVLMSEVTRLFIASYSTQMHGGFLRFQAQYLRRIRLPRWEDVSPDLRKRLVEAGKSRDIDACNEHAFELYGLTNSEKASLGGSE